MLKRVLISVLFPFEYTQQFANNDILSSSSWSAVIHQPAQDSEPEDLPSTVDIDAIKVN